MSGTEGNGQVPDIVIEEASVRDDESSTRCSDNKSVTERTTDKGTAGNGGTRKTLEPTNTKKLRPKSADGKMTMPSKQAGKLTTAVNYLISLKRAGKGDTDNDASAENIVYDAIKQAEIELFTLQEELLSIVPKNELQQRFKDSWVAKNVQKKEEYIRKLKKAMIEEEMNRDDEKEDNESAESSTSAQERQAALEEEALLLLEQEQLLRRQELRRRQREEELREQQERDDVQRKLLEARSRASARSRSGSSCAGRSHRTPSRGADPSPCDRTRRSLQLPQIRQPTPDWLNEAQTNRPRHDVPQNPGGVELMQQMLLGQAKIPCFKGDQLEYLWFRQSFEMQVERVTKDAAQRLYHLLQCLEGEPYRLVRGCQLAQNPEEGFLRAKELLNERYGHPVRQALAFKDKLLEWPTIKSTTDLTNFSIHLQQCQQVKLGSSHFVELDAAATLLTLAAKLPERLQWSWQTKVVDVEWKEHRSVTFDDFMQFIHRQEIARNHPVFGKLGPSKERGVTNSHKEMGGTGPNRARTYITEATANNSSENLASDSNITETTLKTGARIDRGPNAFQAPCLFCEEDHSTSRCKATGITREQKKAKLPGLCFACLKPGHSARFCRTRLKCDVCGGLHPTVLHESRSTEPETAMKEVFEKPEVAAAKENSLLTHASTQYAMATVRVRLWAQDRTHSVVVTALLDAASSATFIAESVVKSLQLPTRSINLTLNTMAGETAKQTSTVQGLKVSDLDVNNALSVGLAYVVEALPGVNETIPAEEAKKWPHLEDVQQHFATTAEPVRMLIGQNVHGAHIPDDVRRGSDDEPFATKTKLGWAIQGPLQQSDKSKGEAQETVNFIQTNTDIRKQLNQLYYRDFDNAYDFSTKGLSQEDKMWTKLVERSIARTDTGRFSVDLPFRPGAAPRLRDNREQALQRLQHLERKFKANSDFQVDYEKFVQKMIDAGHVERVPTENITGSSASNYIPHHGVYHPQKKKIRVVFNCASKFQGLSLNDCLLSGPDLTNSIIGVLCRFRQFRIPFAADIEAMFYQVLVPEDQRDYLRFLWWEEGEVKKDKTSGEEKSKSGRTIATYRMKVHLFGATSSPSVANYALRRTATPNTISTAVRNSILRNFYVDDCLKSVDSTEEAVELAKGLVDACASGGFKLAKFVSSDIEFLRSLSKAQLAKELEEVDLSEDKEDPLGSLQERALGVVWNIRTDSLGFRVQFKEDQGQKETRRTVLSKLSQVYDPIGMAAPVTIVARAFFRDLTKGIKEQGWDEPLKQEDANSWKQWLESLTHLKKSSIPRWMGLVSHDEERYQLHAFCDASTKAYAAAIYIRKVPRRSNEKPKVAFVFGKARVAPPKIVTIPRLELTAAKLASELLNMVQNELEVRIESRCLWSDSQTVLKYIANKTKRFHVFVANRIEAILNATEETEWRYIPSHLNPADDASRGLSAEALNDSKWLQGPEFLQKEEKYWPDKRNLKPIEDEDPEVKPEPNHATVTVQLTQSTTSNDKEPWVEQLARRYSTAFKFRRAVTVWLRVKRRLQQSAQTNKQVFQARELMQAEKAAISWLQREHWNTEIKALQSGQKVSKWLKSLTPTIQRTSLRWTDSPSEPAMIVSILVMQSRTGLQLPIIPEGPLAQLLVRDAHVTGGHMGRQSTMATTRKNYWILHLSKITRVVVKQCPSCQRRKAVPGATIMSALPNFRLTPGPPFETTGVDFFGPFFVRIGKGTNKAYGVIFTCAVSRAVHIEIADSLDISSFINALRRFCARRGGVRTIVCDNATNLTGACEELQKEVLKAIEANLQDPSIVATLRQKNVEWRFNPPAASHFGGFYERIIRSVRNVLTALIEPNGRQTPLTIDLLTTLFCECESILNDRPLTTVSGDPNDLEALTPNYLLLGRRNGGSPLPGNYEDLSKALKRRWKLVQHLVTEFWQRWNKEYKTLLFRRNKWFEKIGRPFRVNDVVVVKHSNSSREAPQLGRIKSVYPSIDGEVRVADVLTAKGTFTRPITKLSLLETASNYMS